MWLLTDWRRIIRKAWSMRLMAIAAILSGLSVVLPLFFDPYQATVLFGVPVPPRTFATLIFVVIVAAMFARVAVQQKDEI